MADAYHVFDQEMSKCFGGDKTRLNLIVLAFLLIGIIQDFE